MRTVVGGINHSVDGAVRNVIWKTVGRPIIRRDHSVSEPIGILRKIAETNALNSPLIPEPPPNNELRFDDHSKISTEKSQPRKSERDCRDTGASKEGKQSRKKELIANDNEYGFIIITCFVSLVLILLILGSAVVATKFYLTVLGINVTSTYSGSVLANSPAYFVNRSDRYGYEKMTYRYQRIRLFVSTSGFYKFQCNIDDGSSFLSVGNIDLYINHFNPANLSINRLMYDKHDEGIHKDSFSVSLRSAINYNLVVSVIDGCKTSFSILITGPAKVIFS